MSGLVASGGMGVSGLTGEEYVRTVADFITWAGQQGYKVVLVPHVVGSGGESDLAACKQVLDMLPHPLPSWVRLLNGVTDPSEVKHVVSQLAWFTGARMHATIAALSTQVPTVATAYSSKFTGVFAVCGVQDAVIDLRRTPAAALLAFWQEAVLGREQARRMLQQHVPAVVERAELQFDDIVAAIGGM